MALSARYATQATNGHLEITIICKKDSKAVLELFVDSSGTGHVEFIPEGATVNKRRYKEILGRKRPEL
jgi:hypothetical protein